MSIEVKLPFVPHIRSIAAVSGVGVVTSTTSGLADVDAICKMAKRGSVNHGWFGNRITKNEQEGFSCTMIKI